MVPNIPGHIILINIFANSISFDSRNKGKPSGIFNGVHLLQCLARIPRDTWNMNSSLRVCITIRSMHMTEKKSIFVHKYVNMRIFKSHEQKTDLKKMRISTTQVLRNLQLPNVDFHDYVKNRRGILLDLITKCDLIAWALFPIVTLK